MISDYETDETQALEKQYQATCQEHSLDPDDPKIFRGYVWSILQDAVDVRDTLQELHGKVEQLMTEEIQVHVERGF